MQEVVQAKILEKTFKDGTEAIKSLTLNVKQGKITGLVGPDGAGKTTLMRMLCGLLTPSKGDLKVLGFQMPQNSSDFLQQIGYMPQKFGLYEDLSIYENLQLYAKLQGVQEFEKRIEELLEFTSLSPFKTRMAGKLSGGMKQKLGLACALIKKPKLLLLDEPGVGVDPISRKELWNIVQELLKEDVSVLWSTSYLDEADMCDEVILLNNGEILFNGNPKELQVKMEERVLLLSGKIKDTRGLLTRILENELVLDAVLMGSSIRVILRKKDFLDFQNFIQNISSTIKVEKITSNFEDAFVDILGVKTQPHSLLASNMPAIPEYEGTLIEAKALTKKFGNFTATDNIDFEIKRGEIFGFLGPNGAGKSTTFKMLCGLLTPTSGKAYVLGQNLYTSGSRIKNAIGYMAQKFSLYANLPIKDNLTFFAGIYGLKGDQKRAKIDEMIEIFDFERYLHVNVSDLPLGLKQRLALACSVMHNPKVLFLDEPTSGVDPITRKEFWTHINGMVKKGVSIMVTTHFMDEAEYCDHIMLIYKGKSIATGTPDDLKNSIGENTSMQEAFIKLIKKYELEER
jgi:ABC-2 type transport system ATP-binding protein